MRRIDDEAPKPVGSREKKKNKKKALFYFPNWFFLHDLFGYHVHPKLKSAKVDAVIGKRDC